MNPLHRLRFCGPSSARTNRNDASSPINRRVLLASVGVALAGCLGDDEDERLDHRGQIEIVIDDEPVDLSADRFQAEHADDYSMSFHLHVGDDAWYNEGEAPVTVAVGVDALPEISFEETGDGVVLEIDGDSYDSNGPGTSIQTYVNDETVDPSAYELADGDAIRIEVETDDSA